MWGLESLGIPIGADGTIALPWWAAAVAAGLIVVLFVLALIRTGMAGTLVFIALVGFGGFTVWAWMEHERLSERHTLEARIAGLETAALAPTSPIACLHGLGGETLEAACERAVFASAESTAGAVAYTASRLSVLNDSLSYAGRRDPGFELALDGLRSGLERDRFGLVAHVLAVKRNCTADRCEALNSFRDANRIRGNLKENTFETLVARFAPQWGNRPLAQTGSADGMQGRAPLPPGYNLPSAASIPPVSIMANEPAAPPEPPAAAPPPPRRPVSRPAQQPPRRQTNTVTPPLQTAPSTRVQ